MERGPIALFGAIIAVGLGPAMWLGAQFGNVPDAPVRPPAVRSEQQLEQDKGGSAGSAPEDPTVVIKTRPRADIKPLGNTPTAHPSASSTGKTPGKTKGSTSPSPTPSDDPTTTPTESTGTTDPPPEGGGDGSAPPPSPPAGTDQITGAGLRLSAVECPAKVTKISLLGSATPRSAAS